MSAQTVVAFGGVLLLGIIGFVVAWVSKPTKDSSSTTPPPSKVKVVLLDVDMAEVTAAEQLLRRVLSAARPASATPPAKV